MFFKYLIVFFVSMVPILELRFAVPMAVGMDLPYIPALITCVIGNMLPVPIIYLFARKFLVWVLTKNISIRFVSSSWKRVRKPAKNW